MSNVIPIRADIKIEQITVTQVEPINAEHHEMRAQVEAWTDTIWLTALKIAMRAGFDKAKLALEQALADLKGRTDQQ